MYYPINIPVDCFDKEQLVAKLSEGLDPSKFYIWKKWFNRTDLLHEEFHQWLDSLGCYVFFVEVFYTPPGGRMMWHIDTEAPSNFVKINLAWGSRFHIMQWGKSKNEGIHSLTPADTKYIQFPNEEITITDSVKITSPTIVNIGVPHRVVNNDQTGRWCLSVNIHKDGERIPLDVAKNIFSEYALG
jgi:hypothetical protein